MFCDPDRFGIKKVEIRIPQDDLETRDKYSFVAPNSLTIEESKAVAQIGRRLMVNGFYYFGERSTNLLESWKTLPSKYVFINFSYILFKRLKHTINFITPLKRGLSATKENV